MHNTFRTDDGYTFMWDGILWVDSFEDDDRDMWFESDVDGWPVDDRGQRLEGRYTD